MLNVDWESALFSTDDLAVEANYRPLNGPPSAIPVIFHSDFKEIEILGGVPVESVTPMAEAPASKVPNIDHNDSLIIDGITYYVKRAEPTNTSSYKIYLSEEPV